MCDLDLTDLNEVARDGDMETAMEICHRNNVTLCERCMGIGEVAFVKNEECEYDEYPLTEVSFSDEPLIEECRVCGGKGYEL